MNNSLDTLKEEFNFYIKHKREFVKQYEGKYIVLQSHEVIVEASSREAALSKTLEAGYKLGTFLVQYVSSANNETIQRFYSRVYC